MKNFIKVLKEINKTLNFLIFFECILNAVIFFLVVYFILSLVNLYPELAAIPAIIYFIARVIVNSRVDKRKLVESKYGPLKEKLRTAADNIRMENPVVDELEEEVVKDLKQVGLSAFIHTKPISMKIFLTILLSFAIVFTTTLNLYIVDLNAFLSNFPESLQSALNPGRVGNELLGDINESEDIYGNSQLAVLGNREIEIKIKPVNYEVSVKESGEVETKDFDEIFPNEVAVEQSSAFEEKIAEEQQELVKNYFNKLAGG